MGSYNREGHHNYIKDLRETRRARGECIQCGRKTLINEITRKPYVLCGLEEGGNNCRGGNNAASNRLYHRKKEEPPNEQQEPEQGTGFDA